MHCGSCSICGIKLLQAHPAPGLSANGIAGVLKMWYDCEGISGAWCQRIKGGFV